jgi:hypothetical protein
MKPRFLFLVVIAVVIVWVILGFFMPVWVLPNGSQAERGAWSDQFGAVSSLFSGLAFAGLLAAIYIQNKELTHAVEGQLDAARQQTKALATQMILQVTDEIRAIEWGKAHDHLRLYHEHNRKGFHDGFARRRDNSLGNEHDRHRRVFLEPCYKVYNLVKAGVVDGVAARIVLTPDVILTLLEVIEPLEEIIRSNYDRSMFDWARVLYSDAELKSRGAYIHRQSASQELSIVGE